MNSDCSGSHTNNNTYRAFGYHPHNAGGSKSSSHDHNQDYPNTHGGCHETRLLAGQAINTGHRTSNNKQSHQTGFSAQPEKTKNTSSDVCPEKNKNCWARKNKLMVRPFKASTLITQDPVLPDNSIIPPRRYYLEKSQARQCGTNPTNDDTSGEAFLKDKFIKFSSMTTKELGGQEELVCFFLDNTSHVGMVGTNLAHWGGMMG
ncbi:hypothetical protein MJO28_016503 [Puccinia striiformis f. sp. tritici]|uniref:Uncharacterized protein n=1 Tax=Puccinia striiformis f. sp. tritici TaxID=168172 RepID=A0ACC0DNB0_9BASI|nr:hypothetical protein MJO28_016503 [Puccinia striiformis f. sp. tritici]